MSRFYLLELLKTVKLESATLCFGLSKQITARGLCYGHAISQLDTGAATRELCDLCAITAFVARSFFQFFYSP